MGFKVPVEEFVVVDDPDLPDDELFRLLPAPDFPTGGEILGLKPEPQP